MRKCLLSLFLAIVSCIAIFAQEEAQKTNSDAPIRSIFHPMGRMDILQKRRASDGETINMMAISSPELFKKHKTGRRVAASGVILIGSGSGLLVLGGLSMLISQVGDCEEPGEDSCDNTKDGLWVAGAVLASLGTAEIAVGVPLLIIGTSKKKRALMEFKRNCIGEEFFDLENKNQYQLNLNVNKNGLGLTLTY